MLPQGYAGIKGEKGMRGLYGPEVTDHYQYGLCIVF